MGHATGTCEGRVSVALLGHFCHPLGFYLGFTVYSQVAEGPSFLEGSGDMAPWKFCEMNTHWDAICCILRHNFEKCCSLALNSSRLDDFSDNYSYLYSVMLTIFFGGKLGSLGGGGKAQPDNGQYHCTWPTRLQKANKIYPSKIPLWYLLVKWIRIATIKPSDLCWDTVRVSLRRKRFLSFMKVGSREKRAKTLTYCKGLMTVDFHIILNNYREVYQSFQKACKEPEYCNMGMVLRSEIKTSRSLPSQFFIQIITI